jgi:hypothetical protein
VFADGFFGQLIRHGVVSCRRRERPGKTLYASLRPTGSLRRDREMAMGEARDVQLFSYGTLRQPGVQLASFGRLLDGCEDALPGYRCSMVEITDPDVLASSEARFHPIADHTGNLADETPGMVFQISEAELAAADAYEVADYKRVLVRLKSGVEAWVYVKAA